jgi:TatD DNase family protein
LRFAAAAVRSVTTMPPPPAIYDTHAHLTSAEFARDLPEVIARAEAAGVTRIITLGITLESSLRAVQLSERYASVYAAVGWHPNHAAEAPAEVRTDLRELARHPKVVAIGETGLDYHHLPSKRQRGTLEDDARHKQKQAALFRQQLELAAELGLGCVIHQRESMADLLALFEPFAGQVRAVFHCYADDVATLHRILGLGSLVSFTGILTYKSALATRAALAAAPLGQFMLETDCPYLAPEPYRRSRCEPAFVRETAATAAQVKGVTLEELSATTGAAAHGFFHKLA